MKLPLSGDPELLAAVAPAPAARRDQRPQRPAASSKPRVQQAGPRPAAAPTGEAKPARNDKPRWTKTRRDTAKAARPASRAPRRPAAASLNGN
jgi:hypothetical protein